MSDSDHIDPKDILNAIDIDKLNEKKKNKRGRPRKDKTNYSSSPKVRLPTSDNKTDDEEDDEIILHLPLTKEDIKSYTSVNQTNLSGNTSNTTNNSSNNVVRDTNKSGSKSYESESNDESTESDSDSGDKTNDVNIKKCYYIIKKQSDEIADLKKFISEITPMYYTEVKIYPVDLKVFDMQNNIIVPKKTNIACWWCTCQFDCLPTFLPEKFSDSKFYVSGCFCSFNCAAAYNLNLNDSKVDERYSLLKQLYYKINKDKITNITDIDINIAGPKELLDKYGGDMTITEYRKNSKILGREYHKLMPPFIPINIVFEETTNSKLSKSININHLITNKNDHMNIKRNKPLNNIASKNIDSYIE